MIVNVDNTTTVFFYCEPICSLYFVIRDGI